MKKDCPICENKLKFEDKPVFIFCNSCKTNLWVPDLLTKDPKECGKTW